MLQISIAVNKENFLFVGFQLIDVKVPCADQAFCFDDIAYESICPSSLHQSESCDATMQDLQPLSRASSNTTLVGRLQSATTITRMDSADLPELTDPETIHKVVKKIRGMYGSCSTGDSQDIMHMLGSIQVCSKRLP